MDARYYKNDWISEMRRQRGLTQPQMARILECCLMQYYRIERGRSCSPVLLAKIAKHFGIPFPTLWRDNPLEEPRS